MAGSSKAAAFCCYQCGVDFEQERALLHYFKSKRHRELENICENVKEVQRQDSQESDTLTVVPVLPEVILPETNSQSWSMSGESDAEPDMDMDVSGVSRVQSKLPRLNHQLRKKQHLTWRTNLF